MRAQQSQSEAHISTCGLLIQDRSLAGFSDFSMVAAFTMASYNLLDINKKAESLENGQFPLKTGCSTTQKAVSSSKGHESQ